MRISIDEACARLMHGEVVAIPTETVYGLAALLSIPESIQRVFDIKQRPSDNPLIIHLSDVAALNTYTHDLSSQVDLLIAKFWPGALTLILPANPNTVPAAARADLPTAAFRMPSHPIARAIARRVGPLVAPSANLSGKPSATLPDHVEADFGLDFPVVDGGICDAGVESTILVEFDERWHIARLGALPPEAFKEVLGYLPGYLDKNISLLCPGRRYRHYAPQCQLILGDAPFSGTPSVVVGYADRTYPGAKQVLSLGPSSSPEIVSHHLYQVLRQLDQEGISHAWVDLNIPHSGLWRTIIERLTRAAHSKA